LQEAARNYFFINFVKNRCMSPLSTLCVWN